MFLTFFRALWAPADAAPGTPVSDGVPATGPAQPVMRDQITEDQAPDPDLEGVRETAIDFTPEDLEKAGLAEQPVAEGEPEEQVEQPQKPERTRNRAGGVPAPKRINQLTGRLRDAERMLQQAHEENERLKQEKSQTESATFGYYKAATQAKLDAAQRDLKAAIESGDMDAQVKAQTALGLATADMAQINAYEAANPKQGQQPRQQEQRPQPQPRQQPQRQVELPPDQVEWLDTNQTWFAVDSPGYDEEMHTEAVMKGRQLERRFNVTGKGPAPGSKAYFDEIDKHMRGEFPDAFDDEPAPQQNRRGVPQMQSRESVAAPTRQVQNNGVTNLGQSTRVSLNPEERQMARRMNLKHPNGKPYTDAEHERAYALNKIKMQAADAENQKYGNR